MYELSIWGWVLAILAAIIAGVAKAGIKGIGIVIITLLALVFGSKASTGIVLVLLMIGDIMAVIYYKRHAEWKYLIQLLPWMAIGVVIGAYVGKDLPEETFKQGMAVIIFVMVIMMFWWETRKNQPVPEHWFFGGFMGLLAGFTTMIGNLAGPVVNIFFLMMRLPKNNFIGTAAWLFFVINIFKFPFHFFVWETANANSLMINLYLAPAVVLGFWLGTKLVARINEQLYRNMILVLTALGAVIIFFK